MHHRPGRLALLALAGLWCAAAAWARPVTLVMDDGRRIDAELITENSERVVVEVVEGIRTTFDKSEVATIEDRKSMADVYRERRNALADDDLDGRYELAYFLFQSQAYELARTELGSILEDFDDADRADRLLRVLDERQRSVPDDDRPAADGDKPPSGATTAADPRGGPPTPRPLTEGQISLIRLWELPGSDDEVRELRPRVVVPRETIEAFIEAYRDRDGFPRDRNELARLRNARGYEQLLLMMRYTAREFYDDVIIRDDPPAMRTFRRSIHPSYVWNYFIGHFGRGQVEGLSLIRRGSPLDQATVYTNFLVLHGFNRGGVPMIDRSEPERSLLIQWGLPRDDARSPAPDVPGWQPYFSGVDDPRFRQALQWIDSLYPDPRYGVTLSYPSAERPTER